MHDRDSDDEISTTPNHLFPHYLGNLKSYKKALLNYINTPYPQDADLTNLITMPKTFFERAIFIEALEYVGEKITFWDKENAARTEELLGSKLAKQDWSQIEKKDLIVISQVIFRLYRSQTTNKNNVALYYDTCLILWCAKKLPKQSRETLTPEIVFETTQKKLLLASDVDKSISYKGLWQMLSEFCRENLSSNKTIKDFIKNTKANQKIRKKHYQTISETFKTSLQELSQKNAPKPEKMTFAELNQFMPDPKTSQSSKIEAKKITALLASLTSDDITNGSYTLDHCSAIATISPLDEINLSNPVATRTAQLAVRYCNFFKDVDNLNELMPRLLRQLSAAVNSSFEPAENYNIGCIITKVFPKSQKEHIIVTASVGDSLAFCFSPHTTEFELLIAPRQFKMKGSIETVPLRISERLEQYMLKVKQVQVPSDTILVSMTFKAYEALSRKCGKVMVSHSEKEYEYREFGFDKVKIVNLLKEVKEQNPKATTSDYRIYLADIIRSRPESKTEIPSKQDAILDLENQIEILTLEDGMTLHVEDLSTINNNHDSTLTIRR